MPGTTVKDALKLFDPNRPLEGDELESYYVARPHGPRQILKTYLQATEEPVKVLFSGHRGSGKSSELRKLARELDDDFYVTAFTVFDFNRSNLNYADIILACAATLMRRMCEDAPEPPHEALLHDLFTFLTNEITAETTISIPRTGSVSAQLKLLLANIEAKYGKETTTREILRGKLYPRVTELLWRTNEVCAAIRETTGKPPLLIVEDMDKVDLGHTRELFFNHAETLTALDCSMIYTFPIALCYSTEFPRQQTDYSKRFLLPNLSLDTRDNTPDREGRSKLKEVITRRVVEEIFEPKALELVIAMSGGLLRNLIRLVRDSALEALAAESPVITAAMVAQTVGAMRDDYRRTLQSAHYAELARARQTRKIEPTETVRQLLDNLSLFEYQNGEIWYDINPVLRDLLDEQQPLVSTA